MTKVNMHCVSIFSSCYEKLHVLSGLKRAALFWKPVPKKAPALDKNIVKDLIMDLIVPFLKTPLSIPAVKFRVIYMMYLQYLCLARFADLILLKASSVTFHKNREGEDTVHIYFSHRKNDQAEAGLSQVLPCLCSSSMYEGFFCGERSIFYN